MGPPANGEEDEEGDDEKEDPVEVGAEENGEGNADDNVPRLVVVVVVEENEDVDVPRLVEETEDADPRPPEGMERAACAAENANGVGAM